MTPEQREDLQWLIHLGMDGKVVAPVHAASIRAALAEIDSLTAEVERRKNAGAWDCKKHREAEQAKTKAALDHAKELETALKAICVEAGGTRDHSPGLCLQQIVGTIETLERAVKDHADHMDVCLEATYKGERDHVRRLLDMKDHDYALINYDLRKAEARINELEQSGQAAGAIICQQRDTLASAERSFRDERRELERLRAVYNRSTSCDISRELDFAEAKLASLWSAGEALAAARWRWCGHSAPDDPLLQAWSRAAGDKP